MTLARTLNRLARTLALSMALLAPAAVRAIDTPPAPTGEHAAAVADATRQTEQWLRLLDAGKLDESWADAAPVFREGVSREDWIEQLRSIKEKLGRTLIRELRSGDFATSLRGAPAGEYVTLVFLTQFEKAPPALESVITSRSADGSWRIAGYNIGAAPAAGN